MASPLWIKRGFIAAGTVNILGVLLFSEGLTNAYLRELDPQVFSTFGLIMIIVWGLAYLAVAGSYRDARWVVGVFALEKLLYFMAWLRWLSEHYSELPIVFELSPLTGAFYVIYGPSDLFFAAFFAWVFIEAYKGE